MTKIKFQTSDTKNVVDQCSLSRIPDVDFYIETCTEEMSPQTTNAVTCAVNLLAKGKSDWVTPFTIDPNVFAIDSSNFRNDLCIGVNDLIDAQLKDPVTHTYNCTRNDSTGSSPFYLLFGRHPRLPIDIVVNMGHHSPVNSCSDYVNKWKKAMEEAYTYAHVPSAKGIKRIMI